MSVVERKTELRIEKPCKVRLRNDAMGEVVGKASCGDYWLGLIGSSSICSWRTSGLYCPPETHNLDIVAIIDEQADDSDPELAARHAGDSNGGDEEEPKAVIDGPGEYVSQAGESDLAYDDKVFHLTETWHDYWRGVAPDGWVTYFRPDGSNVNNVNVRIVRKHEPKVEPPKGDVITGPGRYVTSTGKVAVITERSEFSGGWHGTIAGLMNPGNRRDLYCFVWNPDGTRDTNQPYGEEQIVGKPEPQQEPQLEEPEIVNGVWWAMSIDGTDRIKCHVQETPLRRGWSIDPERTEHVTCYCPDSDGQFELNSKTYVLIRRVRPSTVEPWAFEDAKAHIGDSFLRPDTKIVFDVEAVGKHGFVGTMRESVVDTPQRLSYRVVADSWVRLSDGSPCGIVTVDPWDA